MIGKDIQRLIVRFSAMALTDQLTIASLIEQRAAAQEKLNTTLISKLGSSKDKSTTRCTCASIQV